ncbi:glycosyltransferase family 2 protein [Pseudooceanicola aestuarii]|uniref:glycosyltransferase family 2 protein n=1 Tax=Pseudooceanicola aestuarii TaxID=2697319 RepID=UPI0013CF9302|nr:glycosyltransferase family 2 protein [Pseudooceanicola aestuarii]
MKIHLHIGPDQTGALRLQRVLADKRDQLLARGVLFPRAPGPRNHTRLFMAVSDPQAVDPLRFNRGYVTAEKQQTLREDVQRGLLREVETHRPDVLILSASQLASGLTRPSELERLRALLAPLSGDISVTAWVDDRARLLARSYAQQVMEGRARPLDLERDLPQGADWWDACLALAPEADPVAGRFQRIQTPVFWLDYARLVAHWDGIFGAGATRLRPYLPDRLHGPKVTAELRAAFDIPDQIGKAEPTAAPAQPPAAFVTRARQMNDLLLRHLSDRTRVLPRKLWSALLEDVFIPGPPLDPAALSDMVQRLAPQDSTLRAAHPALADFPLTPPPPTGGQTWAEADPTRGYRPSQYLLANLWRIDRATAEATAEKRPDTADAPTAALSPGGQQALPPLAVEKFHALQTSSFKPHNDIGRLAEEAAAPAYTPAAPRTLPPGSTGNVAVACMKNEAPYILEWIAYHRAVGFDNFLIYTNDCSDGTDAILDRLDHLGVVHHRNNNDWKGNSPQQWALDNALTEPVVQNAEWIAHFDVDEFVNVRCGNGTLADFFDRVPGATNVAMTWRLFGHNGVTDLRDDLVIDQFDSCAPKFCPKPHTVWGFKTMYRNIGAYAKLSCHRPNKLDEDRTDQVLWVNGSGAPMTREVLKNGWRSSKKTIGYDLLQLNHYALRSAESYLVKRQRGRALHVDRSIGLNYWIRMDWCDFRDITIKRNVPRTRAEIDRLMQDAPLAQLHRDGFDWHRAKAVELHATPEFEDLYQQAIALRLTAAERVAYALALDLES